jgi:hypothetical protein
VFSNVEVKTRPALELRVLDMGVMCTLISLLAYTPDPDPGTYRKLCHELDPYPRSCLNPYRNSGKLEEQGQGCCGATA